MSVISVNGVVYTQIKVAVQSVDLVADYISYLCRTKKVRGCTFAGRWFVDMQSLRAYIGEQEALKRVELQKQARLFREARAEPRDREPLVKGVAEKSGVRRRRSRKSKNQPRRTRELRRSRHAKIKPPARLPK